MSLMWYLFFCYTAHEGQVLELCILQVHIRLWRRQRPVPKRGKTLLTD